MKNIFISSTFIDMQAERDLVQERVLPALRDEARKYGDNVGVIDLRWGVDTSALETEEGAEKVLQVCLDEIDRSHPYMLIFLGERYGTMMREDQIEKSVHGREDKYTTDDYVKSITALEVEYGALSEKYGELNHCVVCFREPVVHMLDGAEKELYAEHTEEGKKKLEALKELIKRDLGDDDRLITYSCTWDKSARQLVDFTSNGQPLENILTNCFVEMFRDDWKEYENLSWQDKEQLAFRALMESKLRSFVGRDALLEEYYQSAVNGTCPIILQGEIGSGKTAIMCKLVERLQKEGKNVFAFFAGAGSMSTNAESLVKQMVYYMENLQGIEKHFEEEINETDDTMDKMLYVDKKTVKYGDWMERLRGLCSRLPEGEKVYFCIDALDQLFQDEHVEKLDFFVKGKKIQVIASCTDEFVLPMEAMISRVVKTIPVLSEEDAKSVAGGILASYSRNAYAAIEGEILKKKSMGNPLYISLLIQRLNMMDAEELRKAMTEEEIVALGTGIVREMPEETEKAIVAVIWNGIDKISEEEETLYEILQYLAVSRTGLRMEDLQGIFTMKKRTFPALDIILLMKYLDSYFYVHEDGRVDFTHKVIRHGLLKELEDREGKEEVIKEYLKTLDSMDGLRMREGMYYARIRRDEEFAKGLIEQVYNQKQEGLAKAIKNEAVEDGGEFYCQLIEKEIEEGAVVCTFLLSEMQKQLGLVKGEMQAKLAIGDALIKYYEGVSAKFGNEAVLRELAISYCNMGHAYVALGQAQESLSYYERNLKCVERQNEKDGSEESLCDLSICYGNMGNALINVGQPHEAGSYYKKAYKCVESLHGIRSAAGTLAWLNGVNNMGDVYMALGRPQDALLFYESLLQYLENDNEGSEGSVYLYELSGGYRKMGNAYLALGQLQRALEYYEKDLKCREELYEESGSEVDLRELSISYNNMGNVLKEFGKSRESLLHYKKALKCAESLHERIDSGESLYDLSISYSNMGHAYLALDQSREGLLYFEKAFRYMESVYEESKTERNLRALSINCSAIGSVMLAMGQTKEALLYCNEALKCKEVLHGKTRSEASLRELSIGYHDMGRACFDLGRYREALSYYEEAMKFTEKRFEEFENDANLRELSIVCTSMGNTFLALGQQKEALEYCEKALMYVENLHEKSGSERSLRELSIGYTNVGDVLEALGQQKEALVYYEKALRCLECLHEKSRDEQSLRDFSFVYNKIGHVMNNLGKVKETLTYYEKALNCRVELCEKLEDEGSLRELSISYNNMGAALRKSGQIQEALVYNEKALKNIENIYERTRTERDLRELSISYGKMGDVQKDLGQMQEALLYYEKRIRCMENLHEKTRSEMSLHDLFVSYNNMSSVLIDMGKLQEALLYYEKVLMCGESLHEKLGSERSLRELSASYNNICYVLRKLGQMQEALLYGEKAVMSRETLYEKTRSEVDLRELLISYFNMGRVFFALGQEQEAQLYDEKALKCKEELKKLGKSFTD